MAGVRPPELVLLGFSTTKINPETPSSIGEVFTACDKALD
jgi:hypothetical protein